MFKVVLLVATLVLAAHAFSEEEYKVTFSNWMHEHKRSYSAEEFQGRYEAFKKNMDFVESWNADTTHTHTVELNKFADMGIEEFSKLYMGAKFDATERLARDAGMTFEANETVLADTVNWVTKGAVTGVKDQGQCGSCWSFSTTGSVESANFLAHGRLTSMSEQNLVDCAQPYGPQGCNGGWMDDAFKYIMAKRGLDTEASYPYTARTGTCRFNAANVVNPISGYNDVTPTGNENALVTRINKQPTSVAIDASHSSFQMYKSGIYFEQACSSSNLDHAVLAVGYGSSNGDYYLVKNSWGTGWGMGGYIQMARNRNNNCGIASAATSPNA